MTWFHFADRNSGGDQRTEWSDIYVEADDERSAAAIFEARTGASAYGETCDCCGADFGISRGEDLERLTGFERGRTSYQDSHTSLDAYLARADVLVIRKVTP